MNIQSITPFCPGEITLNKSELPALAFKLHGLSAKLSGQLSVTSQQKLTEHMSVINSYYSNLIEGNTTHPREIRAAQAGNYSNEPAKRDLQLESVAHITAQKWIAEQSPDFETVFSCEFIKEIHKVFYEAMPKRLWILRDKQGNEISEIEPGEWRNIDVDVGRHLPPEHADLNRLMEAFCEEYRKPYYQGDRRLIATMAAHHRFVWIHPFADGNGRVGRLLTDAALKAAGLESTGVWCLSRGLARSTNDYKMALARADFARQGNLDGRGQLSEATLIDFCDYMLRTAIDQVSYISQLLELENLQQRIQGYIHARNDFRVTGLKELSPKAEPILYSAAIQGELSRKQAIEMCAMPERSARRLLAQLKEEGLLSETSSRSPFRWEIPEHAEPWYFPELAPTSKSA